MTPEDMEKLPKPLERLMADLEMNIMAEVVDRIKDTKKITPTINYLLDRVYDIGVGKKYINDVIDDALTDVNESIDKVYKEALQLDYARNNDIYKSVGMGMKPYSENKWLQQLSNTIKKHTKDSVENITKTTGFNITRNGQKIFAPLEKYLTESLDKAMMNVTTGSKIYTEVINETVDEMTKSGLRTVDYASGRKDRIDVAVRRAVLTGVSQLTSSITERNMKELGTDYAEVDWHLGARNTGIGFENHQSWQGKVYSKSQLKTICGFGDMLGLHGINCRHIIFPFIPGISKRKYTDEWLEEQNRKENEKKDYKGKEFDTYEASQRQRLLERTIRKYKQDIKLLERAEADKDIITLKRAKLKAVEKEYVDFSKAMGLKQQGERLRVSNVYNYKGFKFPEVKLGTGTSDSNNDNGSVLPPEKIGTIDPANTGKAIEYYNDKIRNSDIENAIIIDRYGNVYYTKGDEDSVIFGGIDLTGATITHNHPESNGIVSFGEDDFVFIRDNPGIKELFAVNPEYTYSVKVISDMSKLFYSEYNRKAMLEAEFTPDFDIQHKVFEILDREGKVKYAREKYNP